MFGTSFSYHDSLPSHDFVIWTYGSVPFPFGEGSSCVFAHYHFGAETPLPFWLEEYIQAFPLKPAPFCKLLAGVSSAIMIPTSISYSSQILALSCVILLPSFYLTLTGIFGTNYLFFFPLLSGYNGSRSLISSRKEHGR